MIVFCVSATIVTTEAKLIKISVIKKNWNFKTMYIPITLIADKLKFYFILNSYLFSIDQLIYFFDFKIFLTNYRFKVWKSQ